MRRVVCILAVVLSLGSARADITNDVSNISSGVSSIRTNLNNLLLFFVDEYSAAVWDYLSAIYDDLSALHNDLWDPDSDPISVHDSQLQDILDALGSSGDIVTEIINLNAVLSLIEGSDSLIYAILDDVHDGGRILTDPDYTALGNLLQNLGVSINNFSDLVSALENWDPVVTVDGGTIDAVVTDMPSVNVDLDDVDVDFSYFDTWRDNVYGLFYPFSSIELKGYKWGSNVPLGKGEVSNVSVDTHTITGDFFHDVVDLLGYSVNQSGEINRTLIEILSKVSPTNVAAVVQQVDNNMSAMESQIQQLQDIDVENDSSVTKLSQGAAHTVIKDYQNFGRLSSTYSGVGTLGNYIHVDFGDTRNRHGNVLTLGGDIPVANFSGFLDKARSASSICWWLLTFMFSTIVVFRILKLFRYVNNTFFRMPIGFGS